MASTDHTHGFRDAALEMLSREEQDILDQKRYFLRQRSGKDAPPEEEDAGENDWTITYIDMVTLMMAFFVFLTAMSFVEPNAGTPKGNQEDTVKMVSPFENKGTTPSDFGNPANRVPLPSRFDDPDAQTSIHDPAPTGEADTGQQPGHKPLPPGQEEAEAVQPIDRTTSPVNEQLSPPAPLPMPDSVPGNKLVLKLQKLIKDDDLGGQVQVISGADTVTLRISDKILFASGQSGLEASGRALVERLTNILNQSDGMISIEGHTDNLPIHTALFASNWELSAARATEVLRQLEALGLPANRMRAIAYADTRPVADNVNADGRGANRRVELVITNRQGNP